MSQQVINIGAAPNDGGGDQLRASFNKCNDNFTELYAKGVIEGLWNYNKTSTDTSTSPVSGRFKTNSGNYRDATQIAIHAITIQGIDRTSTLRALLVGDSIQCQDSTNSAAWCRYNLQSLPVDHGTWFQLNVTFQTDGGVTSGDNQEIVFVFTASSGGGSDLSAYALLASPTFTGDPQAPTPTTGDNDFSIATTAFVQDAVSSASGGAAGTAEYNFSTTISPPPNSGDIRVNNATPSAVTILWINNVTRLGSDIKRILQQIQVGSKVVIQDKGNSANYGAFQVAGALVDQTTYWEIPVTFSVGAGTIANNARILFGVQAPGATANVSNSGTPTAAQYAKWTDATHIQGVAPATVLSDIGAQPAGSYQTFDATLTALAAYNANGLLTQTAADTFTGRTLTGPAAGITVSNGNGVAGNPTLALANDLAALEALAGTNTIYYRSAIDTWTGVTIGANLTFSGGTLAVTIPANYITSVSAPLSVTGSNLAVDLSAYLTTAAATAAYQPLDGDLTSLAAAAGTNTIYYRSAANTWSPVVVSTGLAFSGGNLTSTGSAGGLLAIQVFSTAGSTTYTPTSGMVNCIIELVGGGGGGGGTGDSTGIAFGASGGGSGAYSRAYKTAAQVGASQNVTVGAAGAGSAGIDGTAGGDSFVGANLAASLCGAKGGGGGGRITSGAGLVAPGAGGAAASGVGDLKAGGAPGGLGLYGSGTVYSGGGHGGSSFFGGGGVGPPAIGLTVGTAGSAYGGGGSGASSYANATAAKGGNGSPGVVIITEYK